MTRLIRKGGGVEKKTLCYRNYTRDVNVFVLFNW